MSDGSFVVIGIAALGAFAFWARGVRKKTKRRVDELRRDMQIDKLCDNLSPVVAISMKSKEIAFIDSGKTVRLPFSDVVSWEHTWVERYTGAGLRTTGHVISFTIRNLDTPLLKVSCPGRRAGDELGAILEIAFR